MCFARPGRFLCVAAFLAALAVMVAPAALAQQRSPAPPGATLKFVGLQNGARIVGTKLTVRFEISGMEVVPAGTARRHAGHHHLLIDTPLPALDRPIPADFNHLHFGGGQTETEISLPPGRHRLQLLFADHDHVPHNPPVMSEAIEIEVVAGVEEKPRTAAAPGARVFFRDLVDGATIPPRATIRFGVENIAISPAGTPHASGGHHHLLIDTETPALDREIPSDFNHVHFGRGQTEYELNLPPGEHTLQLLMGDHDHVPHDPPVMSQRIRVRVVEGAPAPAAASVAAPTSGRKPSPPDAVVYFIYPRDGETIYPRSTIRFGLRNMGVAPAGVDKPDTGHHHLIIDAPTPPLDVAIPADLNHLHFGGGQVEKVVTLTPGWHTLQLILADDQHVPHDPPVMSERIRVFVGNPRKTARRR